MSANVSPTFNSADADVTLMSCDGTLFKVHSQHLAWASGAFPPLPSSPNEVIQLSEKSETLELLLNFVYPSKHSHLHDITFETLEGLAEAAEKYQVFFAMNLCNYKMNDFASKHPAQVLAYACKHDYPHIVEVCSEYALKRSLSDIVIELPSYLVLPWVVYREQYVRAWVESCDKYGAERTLSGQKPCENWTYFMYVLLATASETIVFPHDDFFDKHNNCTCCAPVMQNWRYRLKIAYTQAKPFRSFI
ncbi:hypothetical protein DL96DRAFT_1590326 [Flagelloscypha sp. PMI_526]|nr:hypothetical protein DL96DRAFT_1590326 [Flagelloscypha sp. PMI_526]